MKITKLCFFLIALAAIGLIGLGTQAYAAHSGGDVPLLDVNGSAVSGSVPYSPKQTCGACHNYESDFANATKTQWNRQNSKVSYNVPYPQHGVTAGYHFQQGRNISWDDTQRNFYGLPKFTSSPGMYGKY